ncbi:MAG: M48 family metalloprotease [Candidatus Eiseniibacteriota bacterium]
MSTAGGKAQKSLYSGIAGSIAQIGLSQVKSGTARDIAGTAAGLSVSAFGNSYSRDYEDQADRVGLRYVYEAGYDYKKGPGLWQKFAKKYGDTDPINNFFFGNHSLSSARAVALQKEIDNNYKDPSKDPPTHAAQR